MTAPSAHALALSLSIALTPAVVAQTAPPTPAALAAMADKGDAAGVWSGWNRLAASPDTLRLGVNLAARLGDVGRGLEIYDRLRAESADVESRSLQALALAAASRLASATDLDARVIACSAALRLDAAHRACRTALETMADRGASGGEVLLGAYALVEAGLRAVPLLAAETERLLTPNFRLHLARQGLDLPVTERLALIRPVLTHQDPAYRYQAILFAGTIEDPSILAAIQSLEATSTPIRVAKMVSLASLGHAESVEAVRAIYDGLDDTSKILAGLALARANDARGSNVLDQSLRSTNELTRNFAAETVVRLNPDAVATPLLEAVGNGSSVGRAGALRVAGLVALGTEAAVYRQLGDADVLVGAEAVAAVARTLLRLPATTGRQP